VRVVALTAESSDDGRTDVPGAVAGPVERVVVVGAGIAGLTVANALTGVDVHLAGTQPVHDLDLDLSPGGIADRLARSSR
jgi:aspartate oxidase